MENIQKNVIKILLKFDELQGKQESVEKYFCFRLNIDNIFERRFEVEKIVTVLIQKQTVVHSFFPCLRRNLTNQFKQYFIY